VDGPIFPRFLQDWILDAVLENEERYVGGVEHCRYNFLTHLILDPCKDQHLLCNILSETCRILYDT